MLRRYRLHSTCRPSDLYNLLTARNCELISGPNYQHRSTFWIAPNALQIVHRHFLRVTMRLNI
jgi:hypothetical protein